jgi:hypothetical protein
MAARYRLNHWRRLLNTLVRTFLHVGLGPRHTYLLTVRGRRTGTRYSTRGAASGGSSHPMARYRGCAMPALRDR